VIEKKNLYGVYNLASPENITLGGLAVTIKERCHSKSEIRFMNDNKVQFSEVLASKAEQALGWKAKTTIREILEGYR